LEGLKKSDVIHMSICGKKIKIPAIKEKIDINCHDSPSRLISIVFKGFKKTGMIV
jgi:hypothetical protein